jgi:hypothetical protein
MSKKLSVPQSGRVGSIVNVITRYGQVEKQFVPPRNPQTPDQQEMRSNFGRTSRRWRTLTPEQRAAWRIASADSYTISRLGRQVALNPYNYFIRINFSRAELGLGEFDLQPAVPTFGLNPVGELAITLSNGIITLKLWVPSLPTAERTIVQGAAPCSPGVSCVQHFPFLGFLPAPVDGWSDITALYVAKYGVPAVGKAIWMRTLQHTNGWTDLPKQTSATVPPA